MNKPNLPVYCETCEKVVRLANLDRHIKTITHRRRAAA